MTSITYRPATILDAPDLLRWKNDPVVREFSIASHEEITEEKHAAWMESMLADPDKRTYIVEYNGYPVGDVRVEKHHSWIEIAVKLDSRFRGVGVGKDAITTIGDLVQKEWKLMLIAKIVFGNVASMRAFQKCGYIVTGRGEGFYICSKVYTPASK